MIKCCMFDLDGTLLSTLSTITYYVNKILQKYEIKPISEEECKYFVGNGAKKLIRRALESRGVSEELFENVYVDYLKEYDTDPYYLTEPYDGIPELISELARRGIVCAVISNKQDSATRAAIEHFFGEAIKYVRGGMDGVPLKPDPTAPLQMLSEMGISPSEIAYIGDTGVDMETGKRMGAAITVGVLWGFRDYEELASRGADITVKVPIEILEAIIG